MSGIKIPRARVKCITLNVDQTYSEEYGEMMLGVIRMKDGTMRSGIGATPVPKKPIRVNSLDEIHEIDKEWLKSQPSEYLALFREGDILTIPTSSEERSIEEIQSLMSHFWTQVDRLQTIEQSNLRTGVQYSSLIRNRIAMIGATVAAATAYIKFLDYVGFW